MDTVVRGLQNVKDALNNLFVGKEPWEISTITATSVLTLYWLWDFVTSSPESVFERSKQSVFRYVQKIPYVKKKTEEEGQKIANALQKEVAHRVEGCPYIVHLPENGRTPDEIKTMTKTYVNLGKSRWMEGYVSGTVYYHSQELMDLLTDVYRVTSYTNPLHIDVFPGICKMEAEVVKMVLEIFHAEPESCGTITSGGTESILMACKAYRDYGRETKSIKCPEMVLPRSAHAAFDKAASFFGIYQRHIKLDPETMCVDMKAMEQAINRNTIMLVGSTPNYPYGTMDDIQQIAKLGLKYNIPVHVDCCLGSFIVPFMSEVGYEVPSFDFCVPGVTSISVDTHKYGFAPKGSSLILYSEKKYLHHQYYVSLSWPGGHYGSPAVSGSRPGAIIASCWATLMYFGKSGYMEQTKKIVAVAKYIEKELRNIDGIFVFGKPLSTVVAFGSNRFHIYRLSKLLNEKHWNINMLQFPFAMHICITQLHTMEGVADRFLRDVKEAVEYCLQTDEQLTGTAAVYGMSAAIPVRSLVGDFTKLYLDACYHIPSSSQDSDD